jgi:hypothetical protein
MATMAENVQIIKDSTDAIKQAIIDKGGTIEGDITTWADAISGIETGGGSSSDEEYVFTGGIIYNMTEVTINGSLNKNPDTGRNYLLALGYFTGGICYAYHYIGSTDSYTLTVDFEEPIMGNEIPAICILHIVDTIKYTIIPVKFEKSSLTTNPT